MYFIDDKNNGWIELCLVSLMFLKHLLLPETQLQRVKPITDEVIAHNKLWVILKSVNEKRKIDIHYVWHQWLLLQWALISLRCAHVSLPNPSCGSCLTGADNGTVHNYMRPAELTHKTVFKFEYITFFSWILEADKIIIDLINRLYLLFVSIFCQSKYSLTTRQCKYTHKKIISAWKLV